MKSVEVNIFLLLLCIGIALAAGLLNSLLSHGGIRFWQAKPKAFDLGIIQDLIVAGLAGGVAYFWFWPTDVRQASISILAGISPAWLISAIRSKAEAQTAEDQAEAQEEINLDLLNILDEDEPRQPGGIGDEDEAPEVERDRAEDR